MRISTVRELFFALSDDIARELRAIGLSEEKILADFQVWRKDKRDKAGASGTGALP